MKLIADTTDRAKEDRIHVSDLAYNECDIFLWLLYSGKYHQVFDQLTLWHFAVGKALHKIIQDNFGNDTKNKFLVEQKLEYKSIVGRADIVEISKKYVDVIDIKTTNSFCFEKTPTDKMTKQVAIYEGIIGSTKIVPVPKGAKIRGRIWKVNKGGLPRYFDMDNDVYNVTLDPYVELDNAVKRADNILKCVKNDMCPEDGNISNCSKCPARVACIIERNRTDEKKKYGGGK